MWYFDNYEWGLTIGSDASETGSGPGSYNIHKAVWHVNCCNAELNGGGGWGIFNAILGWENTATYGSVISYNMYWLAVIVSFLAMRHQEQHGRIPIISRLFTFRKSRNESDEAAESNSENHDTVVVLATVDKSLA